MKTIFKYQIPVQDLDTRKLPDEFEALSLQVQGNIIALWAYVDDSKGESMYNIKIVGTAHEFPDRNKWHYLGTAQMSPFVWHVFIQRS